MTDHLQLGFSTQYSDAVFDRTGRSRKAEKVLAILRDNIGELGERDLLDIGCAAGYMSHCYAMQFRQVAAFDIDLPAVSYASKNCAATNLHFIVMDSQHLAFPDDHFDVVICTHIYEHVPDAQLLISEIHRLLKQGGVCFFSAGNRIVLMEPHYRLPLLSIIPKWLAHYYLRLTGRGTYYYENHLTYWGLLALTKQFQVFDYSLKVIDNTSQFAADDILKSGSMKQKFARWFARSCFWLCPTYLWVLKKV